MNLAIQCHWKLLGPLHAGTGLSRGGYADRLIRRDADGNPFLPGDAVKGAIRMSAERLLRWLHPQFPIREEEDKSLPTHPILRRIFQPDDSGVFYHFAPARRPDCCESVPFTLATTSIDRKTRT